MKKITLGALTLLLITTACRDDSYTLSTESPPQSCYSRSTYPCERFSKTSHGIVEAYPCLQGSSILFRELCKQYAKRVLWFFTMFRMETL